MKDKTLFNEQYKYLRTNVKFSGDVKSIVVSSSYFGEGKTSVAANLAKSFALGNHKVVIVDMDLRRPSLRNFFDIDTEIGVTNVVVNNMDYKLAISHDESIWDLDIIHAGAIPPNANELISSDEMKNFIHTLEDNYDYVIIDTPPIEAYSDAVALSAICDATLLVYRVGETRKSDLVKSVESIRNVNGNLIGLVRINEK
ncbi:CpsD/CapB family tyrosine-protein kinase [uncultured Finegoldia sp.]|uniref:CpsD/CapB family tyrosine-protein kinase n=1 Tax=uncultured Finegoldia sp. TaxID=328009 RepID=UPI00260B4CAC|nr:CpsD/CapB family tyrosine-protein kinase [uncultured Finegoldia sp.]